MNLNYKNQCLRFIKGISLILLMAFSTSFLTACEPDTEEANAEVSTLRTGSGETGTSVVAANGMERSCWLCPIFSSVFAAAEGAYKSVIPSVAKAARPLLGVFFAIWLAIRTIRLVGNMNEPDIPGYWRDIGTKAFWLALCFAICSDINWLLNNILLPIYFSFVELGMLVVNSINSADPVHCSSSVNSFSGMSSSYVCLVQAIQTRFNGLESGALALIKAGPLGVMPICTATYVVSVIMAIYFPTLLIDSIARYGLSMCFVPLGIITVGYPQTRRYAGKIINILIGIGMQVVGVCIFIGIVISCLKTYMDTMAQGFPTSYSSLADLVRAAKWFEESPGLSGFIFIAVFCILFSESALSLTDRFGLHHAATTAQTIGSMFKVANTAKQFASFTKNRFDRSRAISDKKTLDKLEAKQSSGKNLTHKERKQAERIKDRMESKGYLARDKQGRLNKTEAYESLGDGKASSYLRGISQDWHQNGSQQMAERQDDPLYGERNKNNKLVDTLGV
ncbi:MAG: type IV secretion system protein [Alphaproteobacteria bacterium]|nr:type IV secretion system protein [Alphaproteobacteria bacterium]